MNECPCEKIIATIPKLNFSYRDVNEHQYRELAAQVAGIASVLSPPNSVRLVTTPTNLVRASHENRERSEAKNFGGRADVARGSNSSTKIVVGSARSIMASLFGDGKLPCPPTSKPEAQTFLKNVKVRTN